MLETGNVQEFVLEIVTQFGQTCTEKNKTVRRMHLTHLRGVDCLKAGEDHKTL